MNEKTMVPTKTENRPLRPFAMFDDLVNDFEQLWQKPWLANFPWRARRFDKEEAFIPQLDVYKKDNELVVKADLPGMKKEDIQVMLEEGDLILKGERKEETEVEKEGYYRAECMYGTFYRRLPLGFEVPPDKIAAKFIDGVLEVRLPVPVEEEKKVLEIPIN